MSQFWQNTQRRLQKPKKIVPEPFQPRRQVLLAEMGKRAGDDRVAPGLADQRLVLQPVDVAVARTRATVPELCQCPIDAGGELSRAVELEIRRLEGLDDEA
jgi:hypothetical protein